MTIKEKSKKLNIYFLTITILSILWIFFGNEKIDNYAPLFFMLSGYPVFTVIYISSTKKLANYIKQVNIDLYNKHKQIERDMKTYSIPIANIALFGNKELEKDFLNIKDVGIKEMYLYTKKCFKFQMLSFFETIVIALLLFLKMYLIKV